LEGRLLPRSTLHGTSGPSED